MGVVDRAAAIHEMYRLLQECGDDVSCGCGCGDKDRGVEPKDKPKKGQKLVVDEAMKRRIKRRIKFFRNLRKMRGPTRGARAHSPPASKAKHAIRTGIFHNRHR